MALIKTITTENGVTVQNAYHRVENVKLHTKEKIIFDVASYVDAEKPAFQREKFSASYDLAGDNPIAQAYVHLKSGAFSGASDA